ncbi:MAG: hypothetical protein HYZ42_02100, partial [Bacteroidetes bacterium]|nr:hypothetical protein [Bacteroidota bacterium]
NNNAGLFRFNWLQDGKLNNTNGFNARIDDTSNVVLNSLSFSDCIIYSYPQGAPSWEWQSESIYAKGVGLVSYTLNGKNKWNVVKYHIIK